VKIVSREITYRSVIEQVFFQDDTELIIKTGWVEDQETDLDITYTWVAGEAPEWAKNKSMEEILSAEDCWYEE
jgi:hypothetical protein